MERDMDVFEKWNSDYAIAGTSASFKQGEQLLIFLYMMHI